MSTIDNGTAAAKTAQNFRSWWTELSVYDIAFYACLISAAAAVIVEKIGWLIANWLYQTGHNGASLPSHPIVFQATAAIIVFGAGAARMQETVMLVIENKSRSTVYLTAFAGLVCMAVAVTSVLV